MRPSRWRRVQALLAALVLIWCVLALARPRAAAGTGAAVVEDPTEWTAGGPADETIPRTDRDSGILRGAAAAAAAAAVVGSSPVMRVPPAPSTRIAAALPQPQPVVVTLISLGAPVTASARGNLGPPSVLTSGAVTRDWLRDRWQAAADMRGTPIPGDHWVQVSLPRAPCTVARLELDWEIAYADEYAVELRGGDCGSGGGGGGECPWTTPSVQRQPRRSRGDKHLLDVVDVVDVAAAVGVRDVRISIVRPATQWGVSLWEVSVFGSCDGRAVA
jgi:hypothetical protein